MSKELIVSVNGREKKIAIVEEDQVTEFYVERGDENQGIVGNIYKGRVMKVLPGMQSAFVDIGLERDSFLYVSDFLEGEEFDGVGEERKETPRPAAPQQRPDRPRLPRSGQTIAAREAAEEAAEAAEAEERDEGQELEIAALKHIAEITQEPVLEPSVDDGEADDEIPFVAAETADQRSPRGRRNVSAPADTVEPESDETSTERYGRRQRRQKRLRYTEPEVYEPIVVPEIVAEAEAEPEEEEKGGRRRRGRRKRADAEVTEREDRSDQIESAIPSSAKDYNSEEPIGARLAEETLTEEIFSAEPAFDPHVHILLHREPLERITDDDYESAEGEILKDAMIQEKIFERIRAEEYRTSILEVDPTPEVVVGSLRGELGRHSDFERISDDEPDAATESARFTERQDQSFESDESPESDSADESQENEEHTAETGNSGDLEDASAELRWQQPREEFATRRGGRGRRRFRRPPASDATADTEDNGLPLEDVPQTQPLRAPATAAAAPPAPASFQKERYHRPVISDLLREGQDILVQIAKEPIGQKGARITSHIALPGRYIVYMPTVEHIGVSRKIGTDEERQRLRRTLHQLRSETGAAGGFIVRTAAGGCTLEALREDMQYLLRTWSDIRRRSERVKGPAIVHRDLDLVQRILRDQLSSDFNAIRVDSEFEYERIVDFVNRFAPKLVHRVKLYTKDTPILEEYSVQPEIDKAVKPRVWLKSGGYIVINQTEALVAIDVNTGKFVGKSNRLEDTIVKTNLEAAKEIVRQIRLRDLGGFIVLDFIDMEERRNRVKVMQALEQELRNDRSPSKILQFNDFGLVAITRKRVKQSLERTMCTPCAYCGGGGMVKSAQTVCYEILSEARRVSKEVDNHNEVILRVSPDVAKALRNTERDVFNEIEAYLGGLVTIKTDPTVHQEQFDIALV
jgi:ribonuclease G